MFPWVHIMVNHVGIPTLFSMVMFGSRKILRKEKKCKEKLFFHVWLSYENIKENQI